MVASCGLQKSQTCYGRYEAGVVVLLVCSERTQLYSSQSNTHKAVTAVTLKVYKYPSSIYSGNIIIPNDALPELAKAITAFTHRTHDPKMAMHLFCLDLAHAALSGQDPKPGIMIVVYDANGEDHGRSGNGFGWALNIKGIVDNTRTMSYVEANQQQGTRTQTVYLLPSLDLDRTPH